MSTWILLFPLFLFGNIHCFGMCGPLVMTLGRHQYRYYYFFGRILSFSLVGMAAGELGEVATLYLRDYAVGALLMLVFGTAMIFVGLATLLQGRMPGVEWIGKKLQRFGSHFSILILQDRAWPVFLFGLCTVLLPCGQSLIVFSSSALAADPGVGLLCGFSLALFTTPSLWVAMHASRFAGRWRGKEDLILGVCGVAIGCLAVARGCADLGWIEHLRLSEHWVVF
jgi:uncharacterized protein